MNKSARITIIGAGLAGSYFAMLLAQAGYEVVVYERSSLEEILNSASRKSYNLTFRGYGMEALKKAGLWEQIEPVVVRLKGSATQISSDPTASYMYHQVDSNPYFTAPRATLLEQMIRQAQQTKGITYVFDTNIISIDRRNKTLTIENVVDGMTKYAVAAYDILIGADGVHSQVRGAIQAAQASRHLQIVPTWEYKQVQLGAEIVKELGWHTDTVYSLTRHNTALFGFPNVTGNYTMIFMINSQTHPNFGSLKTEDAILKFVRHEYPQITQAHDTIVQSVLENPLSRFVTIDTYPWTYEDSIALIGDAAHAFLPLYGMGTSAAFGDCLCIMSLLDRYNHDWSKALEAYNNTRKAHTDVLARLSLESIARYTRNTRADYESIYDRAESILHSLAPWCVVPPVYYLITRDPDRSADHMRAHEVQRRRLNMAGLGVMTHIVLGLVLAAETITHRLRRR